MRWLTNLWCEWLHGGGTLERDHLGRLNWQCSKCGRWSDNPVPREDEEYIIRAIEARQQ